tara:strand:- start:245 stop:976 length:732 start_codon:yes stop_codon:yes gene_type:complete
MNKQLTVSDIQSIVQAGEGYNAEFKLRVPNKLKEISEEICAFANAAGGILLIGVSDDNKVHGAQIDNNKRSAILNALSHRDYYDKGAKITVELFKDRVEVSNPGGLTSAISLADFGTKSHSRNPLIFGLFVRIHMVEQVGSGIGRIRDLMKIANLPEPVFKTEGMFSVVLHRTVEETVEETVGETVEIILNAMKLKPKITSIELQERTGLTRRGVEYHISNLKKGKKIMRVGSTKAGEWKVLT